ncbi:MAG: response regulator transcription factor, partial [Flavobacterium sp.]
MLKIGIAEDDFKIASLLSEALTENNYATTTVHDGLDALSLFKENDFNLLIIDIMLPGINGLQLCKEIRKKDQSTPILMLTAMGTVDDKVNGLEAGADDYLVKPFHLKELLARVAALLRRQTESNNINSQKLIYEDLVLDTYSKEVSRAGQIINLSAKEFVLLELFMKNPNRLLSRQFIAEQAWEINFETNTN